MGGMLPTQTYHKIEKKKLSAEYYRNKLKLKKFEEEKKLKSYPDFYSSLEEKGLDLSALRKHSSKLISSGAILSTLLFSLPQKDFSFLPEVIIEKTKSDEKNLGSMRSVLVRNLNDILPKQVRALNKTEEEILEKLFAQLLKIRAKATLDGQHLNTTYGIIGIEQHLRRYPGDTLAKHTNDPAILREGIAPGLGAWGYFAPSEAKLTPELVETEKWYAVVQTLYLPDWETNQPFLKNWYKYRKVLIVNTKNGKAIVAAIADSGPAAWTGKHFGASPEVMNYLGGPFYKKGPVVLFFVDESEGKMPLGPVEYDDFVKGAGFVQT